jgi:hypothetical protein
MNIRFFMKTKPPASYPRPTRLKGGPETRRLNP